KRVATSSLRYRQARWSLVVIIRAESRPVQMPNALDSSALLARSSTASPRRSSHRLAPQRCAGNRLRFLLDALEVIAAKKALSVKLVDVFRAGWTYRKPTLSGHDLQAADRRAIPRRARQHSLDWLTGKFGGADVSR